MVFYSYNHCVFFKAILKKLSEIRPISDPLAMLTGHMISFGNDVFIIITHVNPMTPCLLLNQDEDHCEMLKKDYLEDVLVGFVRTLLYIHTTK
jgi:hypothetical protein